MRRLTTPSFRTSWGGHSAVQLDSEYAPRRLCRIMHSWLLVGIATLACSAKMNSNGFGAGGGPGTGISNVGGTSGPLCTAPLVIGVTPTFSWDASAAPSCNWPDVFNSDAGSSAHASRAAVDCKVSEGATFGTIFSDTIPEPGGCCTDVCDASEYAVSGIMSGLSQLDACRAINLSEYSYYCCPCE